MGHVIAAESTTVLPSSCEKASREFSPQQYPAARVALGTRRCSVPSTVEDRPLKAFEPSTRGFATITNQSHRDLVYKKRLIDSWVPEKVSLKLKFGLIIPSPYATVIPSVSFHHSLLESYSLQRLLFSLNPMLASEIRKNPVLATGCVVLPEDQTQPPLHQRRDNWNALPSAWQWMMLQHLHPTWTVNLTSSHNSEKHFRQLSELIYSDPYREHFDKEKRINYSSGLVKTGRAFRWEKCNSEDTNAEKTYFPNFQAYIVPEATLVFSFHNCHQIAEDPVNMQVN